MVLVGLQSGVGNRKFNEPIIGGIQAIQLGQQNEYGHNKTQSGIVDNIPKPILDAFIGLVYLDDEQVTDMVCRKRNLEIELRIENPSSVLAEGLGRGNEFLHILAQRAPDQGAIY